MSASSPRGSNQVPPLAPSTHWADGNSPWLSPTSRPDIADRANPYPASPAWALPVDGHSAAPPPFAYPETSLLPTTLGAGYVAPPHQQPLSEYQSLHPNDASTNLGFPTFEDWFGNGHLNVGGDDSAASLLDLQDFFMKVGPGEAQGGFPFK